MANSKRAYAKWGLPRLLLPVPPPLSWCPDNPHLHRVPSTLVGVLVQSPVELLLLFSGSWCVQYFVCTLQDWSLWFPQFCGSPIIKSHWPSRSDSLGIPSPFDGFPVWEAWSGVQNLHNSGKTSLVLLFSSLWITHMVGMGFDFIMIAPLLTSHWGFVFGIGYLFFRWVPASSCQWLFNNYLHFWCSCRRNWVHILLFDYLEPEASLYFLKWQLYKIVLLLFDCNDSALTMYHRTLLVNLTKTLY